MFIKGFIYSCMKIALTRYITKHVYDMILKRFERLVTKDVICVFLGMKKKLDKKINLFTIVNGFVVCKDHLYACMFIMGCWIHKVHDRCLQIE